MKEFRRDHRLFYAASLLLLLALCAIVVQYRQVRTHEDTRIGLETTDRQTWLNQGSLNPHAAAHFSSWAFRPATAMSLLDPGVLPYTGSAIWMEAHVQDTASVRPVEDRVSALDVGEYSVAWTIQMVFPLLIALLTAGLVVRERERGTLRLIYLQAA